MYLPGARGNRFLPWQRQPQHARGSGLCFFIGAPIPMWTAAVAHMRGLPLCLQLGVHRGTVYQGAGNTNKWRQPPLLSTEAIFGGTILRVVLWHSTSWHFSTFASPTVCVNGFSATDHPYQATAVILYALSEFYTQCNQHLLFIKQ